VVELFSSKVRKLPFRTRHILDHCACMGNRFTAEDVALVLDFRIEQLFEDLKPVLNWACCWKTNPICNSSTTGCRKRYCVRLIPDPADHTLGIGNRLLEARSPGNRPRIGGTTCSPSPPP